MYDFFSDSILFFQLSAICFNKLYTNKLPFQSYNLSIAVPAALTGDTLSFWPHVVSIILLCSLPRQPWPQKPF